MTSDTRPKPSQNATDQSERPPSAKPTLWVERASITVDKVSREEVLRYLGYHSQELTTDLQDRIAEVEARCLQVARTLAAMRSFAICAAGPDFVELEGCAVRLEGGDIARHLADATEVALLAVTLGVGVDQELRRLAMTDSLGQLLFDAVATALVERATDAAEAKVRAYAANKDMFCSWRFSPGYGDLSLDVQSVFLAALDATRRLGISLTASNLMVPTKSVTAIVGIHPTPQPGLASSCSVCSLADFCTLRRSGTTCRTPNP